jgi:chemotaxis protein methyltransferase CheR
MRYLADSLGLSGQVSALLLETIHDRLGLHYEPTESDRIADRLAPLVIDRGLGSFMDLYYRLKYSEEPDDWSNVMDALSVQETYFWREIDQLRAIADVVVPQLAATLRGTPLRIWSTACATGEEPLTIAMLLSEAGWFGRHPIEIVASDASRAAIARAEKGEYTHRSFRNLPVGLRDKYFVARDGQWRVDPELHRRVSYDVVNLVNEGEVRRYVSAPVICCRNVFIYFSDRSIRRTLSVLERWMPSPGYLCIGVSESLLRRTSTFELQEVGGAFMYVKSVAHEPNQALASGLEAAS